MAKPALDALETVFPDVVTRMSDYFDSHDFIVKLAQAHQRIYVEALAAYAATDRPFQIVHGEIARRLLKHPELVSKVGERDSEDIFRQKNASAVWCKLK
jgi:hypothetical protein